MFSTALRTVTTKITPSHWKSFGFVRCTIAGCTRAAATKFCPLNQIAQREHPMSNLTLYTLTTMFGLLAAPYVAFLSFLVF